MPQKKGGFRPLEKEPADHPRDIHDIPRIGTEGVGTEQSFQPVPPYILLDKKKMDAHGNSRKKVNKGNHGAYSVDQSGVGGAAVQRHKKL